jgi:hypothetical protein
VKNRRAPWDSIPASDDLTEGWNGIKHELDEVHLERRHEALGWVEQRVSTRDEGIFRQLSFGGRKPTDLGAELAMPLAAVHPVKYRMHKAAAERFDQPGSKRESSEARRP